MRKSILQSGENSSIKGGLSGHNYPTKDGSTVRGYIHVMDLADGHIAALRKLFSDPKKGCTAYNQGTGRGTSVLEMVAAFKKASGKKIPIKLCPKRPGDMTAVYASTEKLRKNLAGVNLTLSPLTFWS